MRNLLLTILLVGLFGCASTPKSGSASKSQKTTAESDFGDFGAEPSPSVEAKAQEPAQSAPEEEPAKESKYGYDDLNQAMASNNNKKVEEIASQLLAKNQKDVGALNALAVLQIRAGRPAMARLILKKALDGQPSNSALLNNLAVTYFTEGEEAKGFTELKKAAQASSADPVIGANLGSYHLKYRNYAEARKWLETAYEKKRDNPKVANNFGVALRGVGDHQTARRVFETALEKNQKDQNLLTNYAILLIDNLGDKTKGQEVLNKIRFLGTDPAIMETVKRLEAKLK